MAEKYLFLGKGSSKDPGFNGAEIKYMPYRKFMEQKGIKVVDDVVMSCHGCPDLMSRYAREMQYLAEQGRVVAVLQGGLLFGLPSIFATQTTFPIISVPTDCAAYTSFMVPSGHAAIATVGVEREDSTLQREKALTLAERILNLGNPIVNVIADNKKNERVICTDLEKYGVEFSCDRYMADALSLVYGEYDEIGRVPQGGFAIYADSDENMDDWDYFCSAERKHHEAEYSYFPNAQARGIFPNAQARGIGNLAIMAAKIVFLQKPELGEKIKDIAIKKRRSYPEKSLVAVLTMGVGVRI